ncbi:hypothetical protein ACJQWK_00096 [Exserohilum turcicum]|uniref:Photosynthesis system II assembly factor Ycf48/Hcf136-like domain-containing protein n=1 Tax=Exserohilum turcicum (strain 28A) TaxID=671987 RepID=R0K225_EXST2|nr:uncharacterized protein SETTUDRAFT_164939 [Exserohilum turcica Et28A]EOA83659.1 hypothetical protein SETTUDRAFT_164939 [Exserohilum turcica Et28A]
MKLLTALFYTASLALTCAAQNEGLKWVTSPTLRKDVQYLGMSAINKDVVWLSGTHGTIIRTTDGGAHWEDVPSPVNASEKYSVTFKAIHAFSDKFAVVLADGAGSHSRIFLTGNAGERWRQTFTNNEQAANYQCMGFGSTDGRRAMGVAASGPVNGRLRLIQTIDAGETWTPVSQAKFPLTEPDEKLLPVSSCVTVSPYGVYVATADTKSGRTHSTVNDNLALGWQATSANLTAGVAGGASNVAFHANGLNAVVVGGPISFSSSNSTLASWAALGGDYWYRSTGAQGTFLSSASWAPLRSQVAVAVGPDGSVITHDSGKTWEALGKESFTRVSCNDQDMCWAAGEGGVVGKLDLSVLSFR